MKHYDSTHPYPRDLVGYGKNVPHAQWPGGARVAVQFVLNYEEGGENCVLHGDAGSEQFLSEMFNPASFPERHISMEGIYEYGSRAGVWRILREFEQRGLPLSVFGVGMALQRHPELTSAFIELGHEIACHGWRWIHYQNVDEATEREHMQLGMAAIEELTGQRALGWYTGRDSPRTRRLVADYGGFEYDSDYYGDDLPFWMRVQKTDGTVAPQLMQGHLDLVNVKWDGTRLTGKANVVAGEPFKIVIALNGFQTSHLAVSADGQLGVLTIERSLNEVVEWSVH